MALAIFASLALTACAGKTTGATKVREVSATLNATASCEQGQTCTWYWEYWPANKPRSSSVKTPAQGPVSGPTGNQNLSIKITGLIPDSAYRWVFCASPNHGVDYACAGPNGKFGSTTADPPPDYATFTTRPQRTLAEAWNGISWTRQPTPNPPGATHSSLSGVSCPSATACTAVGFYTNGAGTDVTLAELWNGTSWAIQPTANPSGATGSALSAVSCTSATACTAVGYYTNSEGNTVTLTENWDGTSWTIKPAPSLPAGSTYSALAGVSCASGMACTAVGDYFNGTAQVALAERWNGTSWTIQSIPNPSGAEDVLLQGTSCTSATACTAVGDYFVGSTQLTLAEHWDGTSWTIQPNPNPAGQTINTLRGVSCASPTACTAVGTIGRPDNSRTQAEGWDGTSWTIEPTAEPSNGVFSRLLGVSCTSATACTAVGGYTLLGTGAVTLAERWDGVSWTIQPTRNPPGALERTFNEVSCTSATTCTAVGDR